MHLLRQAQPGPYSVTSLSESVVALLAICCDIGGLDMGRVLV